MDDNIQAHPILLCTVVNTHPTGGCQLYLYRNYSDLIIHKSLFWLHQNVTVIIRLLIVDVILYTIISLTIQ